jgi:hypothetical protein
VVYDAASSQASDPRVRDLTRSGATSPTEGRRILDMVFGAGRYVTDSAQCPADSSDLEQARARGAIAPRPTSAALGAFVRPGSKQEAWVFATGECGALHADGWGTATIAIVEGTSLVARAFVRGAPRLAAVFDSNGDGIDELLLVGGSTGQGIVSESATLHRFLGDRLVEERSFGEVHSSTCDAALGPKMEHSVRIELVVRPGATPELVLEPVQRACR